MIPCIKTRNEVRESANDSLRPLLYIHFHFISSEFKTLPTELKLRRRASLGKRRPKFHVRFVAKLSHFWGSALVHLAKYSLT